MKFKLVEEFDSGLYNKSTIDTLNESASVADELANHLLSDMSDRNNRSKGYKASLSSKQKDKLKECLLIHCKQKYNISDDNEAITVRDDIWREWPAHHINGIHPYSMLSENNNAHNIALVHPDLHPSITATNKSIIKSACNKLPEIKGPDIDKLIYRIVMICKTKNIPASSILKIGFKEAENIINNIVEDIDKTFRETYVNNDNVIYLEDVFNEGV